MMSDYLLPIVAESFRRQFAEFGGLLETMEIREIGGWAYNRLVPRGGKDRRVPPGWVMWLAVRTLPSLRRMVGETARAYRDRRYLEDLEKWYSEWRDDQKARIAAIRAVDLRALPDVSLGAHTASTFAFAAMSFDRHLRLGGAPSLALTELVFTCEELLGWGEQESLRLLQGLSPTSTLPAAQLAPLARLVSTHPAIGALLETADGDALGKLRKAAPEFTAAFDAYQLEFGCRALRYELAATTLEEVPEVTLKLVYDQAIGVYDPEQERSASAALRQEALQDARRALDGRPGDLARFSQVLGDAERFYPLREENEFWTVSIPLALQRFAALEVGRRLAGRGVLAERDDVFFLTVDEALAALAHGGDRQAKVAERRAAQDWALAHPGPPSYGRDPGLPPLGALPREAAQVFRGMLWLADRIFGQESGARRQTSGSPINGTPASPGQYTGTARILLREEEFGRLQLGDVLVCPITSPVWSVLFPNVGALVTDSGGILSHPAIIAREYGIPAVVATGNATEVIRDGDRVSVDGTRGLVTVLPADSAKGETELA